MQALGIAPENAVLVGDMITDSELADALGTACVLVEWGHNSCERLETTGRTIAHTCDELLAILEA